MKKELPVNFRCTREVPLSDMPERCATGAAEKMHTASMWTGGMAGVKRLGVYSLDPVDLAVYLLCTMRRRRLYGATNAEIARAFGLEESHVKLIYRQTKAQVTGT